MCNVRRASSSTFKTSTRLVSEVEEGGKNRRRLHKLLATQPEATTLLQQIYRKKAHKKVGDDVQKKNGETVQVNSGVHPRVSTLIQPSFQVKLFCFVWRGGEVGRGEGGV